jgi:hypothetical protein
VINFKKVEFRFEGLINMALVSASEIQFVGVSWLMLSIWSACTEP